MLPVEAKRSSASSRPVDVTGRQQRIRMKFGNQKLVLKMEESILFSKSVKIYMPQYIFEYLTTYFSTFDEAELPLQS